jgi:hypothetical protein
MDVKYNVLIYPAGSEIGTELYRSLSEDMHIDLFGYDSDPLSLGSYLYKNYVGTAPLMDDPEFEEYFRKEVAEKEIDFILPANDDAIVKFKSLSNFPPIAGPSKETCDICRSKSLTYDTLREAIEVPIVYNRNNIPPAGITMHVKPIIGSGSKGCYTMKEVEIYTKIEREGGNLFLTGGTFKPEMIYTEYLPGTEYTVDCFTDHQGNLRFVGPRIRERTISGISVSTIRCEFYELALEQMAERISRELRMRGAWFFQAKKREDGVPVLLEVAPRIGGSSGLQRYHGVNLPLLTVWDMAGQDVTVIDNAIDLRMGRPLDLKFHLDIDYKFVFVDLNDTLVYGNGTVNTKLIAFLYQCWNKGKHIYLISSFRGDINEIIEDAKLPDIFKEIIHLGGTGSKADYIWTHGLVDESIIIDDSFAERLKCHMRGIRTFDNCAVDCLMEE